MRHLAIAFAGEGQTDYQFLPPLLERHVEALVLQRARTSVGIAAVQPVLTGPSYRPSNQIDAVVAEFEQGRLHAHLLFVHTDAGADPDQARAQRISPLRAELAAINGPLVVGVVPDRETEAWMLADGAAIERVLGLRERGVTMPVAPKQVSTVLDPKRELDGVLAPLDERVRRARRARRTSVRHERLYQSLGGEISLTLLEQVPSFQNLSTELVEALQSLNLIT